MTTDDDRRPNRPAPNRAGSAGTEPARTMRDVSHTNPVTGKPFGESQAYARGRTIAADGGEAEAADEEATEEKVARVKDVDHTPREGAPDASAVYERGGEGEMANQDDETEDVPDGDEAEE